MQISLNNLNSNQKAPNFNGKYYISGSKKAVKKLYQLIKNENAELNIPTDCCDFSKYSKLVLTESDLRFKNPELDEENGKNMARFSICADEVLNKKKTALKKTVPLFNAITGYFKMVQHKSFNKMKFCAYANNNGIFGLEETCKFPNKMPISEALQQIDTMRAKRNVWIDGDLFYIHAIPDINKALKTIAETPNLRKLKTNHLLGAGTSSVVFDIGDNKALKLSHRPCYPNKLESFDLPISEKGYSPENGIYWCINEKAPNHLDVRIKQSEIKEVINDIKSKGYATRQDLNLNTPHQFVMINNKPYLIDYDCVTNSDGSSRMFDK